MYRTRSPRRGENLSIRRSPSCELARCFEQLEQKPRHHPNIKPLKGKFAGFYRYQVWRLSRDLSN